MTDSVLFVDDDTNILNAFTRQMRQNTSFSIETASNGPLALQRLQAATQPFGVVVVDMRMPGMDGIALLKEVRRISPLSVRIMLTGNTDQKTAMDAVNTGSVFRFLNKPCSSEDLLRAVSAGLEQYRLVTAEKELLHKTLGGTIKLLTDILSAIDPLGFQHSLSLRETVKTLSAAVGIENSWDIELAAMLGGIGAVTLPPELSHKVHHGQHLLAEEEEVVRQIPEVGHHMLANIPRLEKVAEIVLYQNKNYDGSGFPTNAVAGERIPRGARVLKAARDLARQRSAGLSDTEALETLQKSRGSYDPAVLTALSTLYSDKPNAPVVKPAQTFAIKVNELTVGQMVLSKVETSAGLLLVSPGVLLTEAMVHRLRNYHKFVGLKEPITVDCRIPINQDVK